MKKILFAFIALGAMILASCSNEDIEITTQDPVVKDAVTVNVSLSNFYQSYDFYDTYHDLDISDIYRTFHSDSKKFIEVRTLFYKAETGELQDSVINYVTTTNNVVAKASLPTGTFYAITTLVFADKAEEGMGWWDLADKENLSTAKMVLYSTGSRWGLMSVSTEKFTVTEGKTATITTTPEPVGALCYIFMHNFQYKDEATYNATRAKSDNNVRALALYTQNKALEYNLNPLTSSKVNYVEDAGKTQWYWLNRFVPEDFGDGTWEHFMTNLYGFSYIIAPEFNLRFGYVLKGENSFKSSGELKCTMVPGKTYLAYWDWFKVGEYYFGPADNEHWHVYDEENSNARKAAKQVMTAESLGK